MEIVMLHAQDEISLKATFKPFPDFADGQYEYLSDVIPFSSLKSGRPSNMSGGIPSDFDFARIVANGVVVLAKRR